MSGMTELEQNELKAICAKPLSHYKRNLKWHAVYAIGGFCLLVLGLIWLRTCRAPTVTQAMYFCGFVGFANAIGYYVTVLLDYKRLSMIHHLQDELFAAKNESAPVTPNPKNAG